MVGTVGNTVSTIDCNGHEIYSTRLNFLKMFHIDFINLNTHRLRIWSIIVLVALWSHLSGCFRLFAPKFWEVVKTYEWYFVIL